MTSNNEEESLKKIVQELKKQGVEIQNINEYQKIEFHDMSELYQKGFGKKKQTTRLVPEQEYWNYLDNQNSESSDTNHA